MSHPMGHGLNHRLDHEFAYRTVQRERAAGGHSIEEMVHEAARIWARQLSSMIAHGCFECGQPAKIIAYPPTWEATMIREDPRVAHVVITNRVRLLCVEHAHVGW